LTSPREGDVIINV